MRNKARISFFINFILMMSIIGCLDTAIAYQSSIEQIYDNNLAFALSNSAHPEIDIATWTLSIDGSVSTPLNLTYDEFRALPAVTVYAELICVSGAAHVAEGNWTGVQLSYILNLVGATPQAFDMIFYAADGYSSSLPIIEVMKRPDMILAYEKDGESLPTNLGYPVIVVAPGKWGYKWVKWVISIELSNTDYQGFWESAGYSDIADIPDYEVPPGVPVPSMGSENPIGLETTTTSITQVEMTRVPEFDLVNIIVFIFIGLLIGGYKKQT